MNTVEYLEAVEIIKKNLTNGFSLMIRALTKRGLGYKHELNGGFGVLSQPFISYELSNDLVQKLIAKGYSIDYRPDGIITLSDQKNGYWNFRNREDEKDELIMNLAVEARVSMERRGVVLRPSAQGTFVSSAHLSHSPSYEFFKAISEIDLCAHWIIKDIVAEEGEAIVSWFEMDLAGIRDLSSLFDELAGDNQYLKELAHSAFSPFSPNPYGRSHEVITYFLPEYLQAKLFQVWKYQLESFKKALACRC